MRYNRSMKHFILIFIFFMTSSCANILEPAADKNTDEALYEEALKLNNQKSYDASIAKFEALSASFLSQTEVREAYASALAGKCGLDFLTYIQDLGNADLGSTSLFRWFSNAFVGVSVSPEHCLSAQEQMMLIGATAAERNAGQNLFMAVLGMVKIGTYLRNKADVDGTGSLGDGTIDASFDICLPAQFSNDEIRGVITGLGLVLENIGSLSSSDVTAGLGAISTTCGATCNITDPDNIDDTAVGVFRTILDTQDTGVGTCTDDPFVTCCL